MVMMKHLCVVFCPKAILKCFIIYCRLPYRMEGSFHASEAKNTAYVLSTIFYLTLYSLPHVHKLKKQIGTLIVKNSGYVTK